MTDRIPTGWANYRGDVRGSFDEFQVYGPDYNGELRYVVETSYDEATDRTRVGFSRIAPGGAA